MPDGRRLIQPQPAARGLLTRVLRAVAQLRLQQRRVGAQAPRRQLARQPRRALRLRLRDQLLLGRQLRGGGVPRDARPRVDAAPVQLPAQRRRAAAATPAPPGTPRPRPARTAPPRPGRAAAPAPPARSSAGSRRHHQGQLLEQVVPGPGGLLLRHQRQGLLPPPGPAPRATADPPGPGATDGCRRGRVRAARVRHRGRDARQLAAERGVPPRGQRVPVDLRPRPCPCVTAAWRRSRCTAARVRSARGRAAAPTPAPARVPSRAPARSAWNTRPSAPA